MTEHTSNLVSTEPSAVTVLQIFFREHEKLLNNNVKYNERMLTYQLIDHTINTAESLINIIKLRDIVEDNLLQLIERFNFIMVSEFVHFIIFSTLHVQRTMLQIYFVKMDNILTKLKLNYWMFISDYFTRAHKCIYDFNTKAFTINHMYLNILVKLLVDSGMPISEMTLNMLLDKQLILLVDCRHFELHNNLLYYQPK